MGLPNLQTKKMSVLPFPQPPTSLQWGYVTVKKAAIETGLTEKAIRRKVEEGKWIEGEQFVRSPDGGIFVSQKGFLKWLLRGKK